jgi:hypothetical protein
MIIRHLKQLPRNLLKFKLMTRVIEILRKIKIEGTKDKVLDLKSKNMEMNSLRKMKSGR